MNGTNDLNILFNNLKLETPQKCSFLSPPTAAFKNLMLNDDLNYSNSNTSSPIVTTSTSTSPRTPEAVRVHGGTSPVPFDIMDKILSLIKEKLPYIRGQRNLREIEHKKKRLNQITKQRSRSIKNPLLKKLLQKKQE
uniref:Uncharacterized protein n=1 Tax=Strongyloides stercoralis TaxID=6248 RepID=A0A0K0EEB5_STRER